MTILHLKAFSVRHAFTVAVFSALATCQPALAEVRNYDFSLSCTWDAITDCQNGHCIKDTQDKPPVTTYLFVLDKSSSAPHEIASVYAAHSGVELGLARFSESEITIIFYSDKPENTHSAIINRYSGNATETYQYSGSWSQIIESSCVKNAKKKF